jgi:hypothetical protein
LLIVAADHPASLVTGKSTIGVVLSVKIHLPDTTLALGG